MRRVRFTIARLMVITAVLAANAGLVRAFVVEEMSYGGIFIFIDLLCGRPHNWSIMTKIVERLLPLW